jgi:hypothetical protein
VAVGALLWPALAGQAPVIAGPTDHSAKLTLSSTVLLPSQTVTATMTVLLPGGAPASNVPVAFSSSGDVHFLPTTCRTDGNGKCSSAITVGGGYGSQTITGKADPLAQPGLTDSLPLFEYDAATSIGLSLAPNSLQKDAISVTTATATPRDAQGRPVMTLQPVAISDSFGLASPVTDNHDGTYTAKATAPQPKAPSAGTLTDTWTASVSSPALTTSAPLTLTEPTPRVVGPLTTSGKEIRDGNNSPIRLKGIDATTVYASNTDPKLLSPIHVGNLYVWGANSVRVMLSSSLYMGDCGVAPANETYPPNYRDAVQKEVDLINSFGMVAVLDLHLSNPGCQTPRNSANGQYGIPAPLPAKAEAEAFMADLATRYGTNHPLVAFELYNEPFVCGRADGTVGSSYGSQCPTANFDNQAWVNGGMVTFPAPSTTPSYLGAGMKSLYDAVRNNGAPNSLVFVDANHFASDKNSFDALCATPGPGCLWVGATNVVYVFHVYDCQETDAQNRAATCEDSTPESCTTVNPRLDYEFTVPGRGFLPWPVPVDINEFGFPQGPTETYRYKDQNVLGVQTYKNFTPTGNGRWLNNVISYLDGKGLSWSVFAYDKDVVGSPGVWQGPYTHVQRTDTSPWTSNANGDVVRKGFQGQTLTCY